MTSSANNFEKGMERIEKLKAICLSTTGATFLQAKGVLQSLAEALKDEGIAKLEQRNIRLLPMTSPAAHFSPAVPIAQNTPIIILDINAFAAMTSEERVVVFLHEIGHVLFPKVDNQESELAADDFVVKFGQGPALLRSLERHLSTEPAQYDTPINQERIRRLKINLGQKSPDRLFGGQ